MILSRTPVEQTQTGSTANTNGGGGIVQCTGNIFEGEGGQKYARLVEGLVSSAARGVGECDAGVSKPQGIHFTVVRCGWMYTDVQDELRLMRIRTKRHELIITPGKWSLGHHSQDQS
jgi:dynein light chain roadblock-type